MDVNMQHQDIEPSLGAGQFYNFIFYPFSTSKASGGIKLVPFSHIQNNLTLGEPYGSLEDEIELFPEAGDLLIVDGCCFHSVPKNTSNEDRYSIVGRFIEQNIKDDKRLDIGVYRTGKFDYSKGKDIANETATI